MLLTVGSCVLDTSALEVRRDGLPVPVEPKVFDLLMLLAVHCDRVVSRDEIVEKLWSGRVISDDALFSCIKSARRALGDNGKAQQAIRTVPRRGFRMVCPVVRRGEATAIEEAGATKAAELPVGGPSVGLDGLGRPSLAVTPFQVLGDDKDGGLIADGLVQDIITGFGRSRLLHVIARGTVLSLPRIAHDAHEIGRTLGVRYVLSGYLQHQSGKIRLNLSLADVAGPFEVWADTFERNVCSDFALQDDLTELVVGHVLREIEQAERHKALSRPLADLDAWSCYYRAWWHLDRHSAADYDRAEVLLRAAAQRDPGAGRIQAALSFVHRQRAFLGLKSDRDREVGRALELASYSTSLEPNDCGAHWALGRALMLRHEVEAALQEFEIATSLNPSFALGQYSVGFARAMLGDSAASDRSLIRARQLSPLDPMRFAMLATHAFNSIASGDYDRAATLAELAAAQPNAHFHIVAVAALCSSLSRRKERAERSLLRLASARPEYRGADFFEAFPFQAGEYVGLVRRQLERIGIPL